MLSSQATDLPLRKIHSIKEFVPICAAHNLRLDTDLTRLQGKNLQLCQQTTPTLGQERAALIYFAVTAQFCRYYQSKQQLFSSGTSGYPSFTFF
jgi:hypothetical protein